MDPLIQLKGQELQEKILKVFSKAADRELASTDKLSAVTMPFGNLVAAIRKLDVTGAFIPEADLKTPGLTFAQLAARSEARVIVPKAAPSVWDRVRRALSQAGAMPWDKIRASTKLAQIGVGSDWIGYLDAEFEPEGLRFFDSDFEDASTADDVFQVVLALLDKKTA